MSLRPFLGGVGENAASVFLGCEEEKKGTSAIFYDEIPFVIYNSTSSEQNNEIPSSGNLSFTAFTMAFTFSAFSFVT